MSTEAPAAPAVETKPKRTMSDDQKAKIAAGRAKWLAEKAAKAEAAPSAPAVDPRDAEIAALKARLAAATPVLPDVSTLPTREAYFEFVRPKGTAMEKITTLEDERWGEMTGGKWYGRAIIGGTFVVRSLARAASGEILEDKCVMETCKTVDHPLALTMLKAFLATGDHTRIA